MAIPHWRFGHRTEVCGEMYPLRKSPEFRLPGNGPLVSTHDDVVTCTELSNAVSDEPMERGPRPSGMRSRGG